MKIYFVGDPTAAGYPESSVVQLDDTLVGWEDGEFPVDPRECEAFLEDIVLHANERGAETVVFQGAPAQIVRAILQVHIRYTEDMLVVLKNKWRFLRWGSVVIEERHIPWHAPTHYFHHYIWWADVLG